MKRLAIGLLCVLVAGSAAGNGNVYVSRFWHNHQPVYWPEWNGNGSQTERVQYAWDSIVLKPGQGYSSGANHPENNLVDIFGKDDRRNAYQSGPRNSLAGIDQAAGFAMSYSGSLIDNVNNLGDNGQLGYGGNWWDGNREASGWKTSGHPDAAPRLDLLGFTHHHSLGPLLPKAVFRKEIEVFKETWWKAWAKSSDKSDHSKGFFPTEMAFSRHMIDVLVEQDYQWVIVASHHLSRTCPTYFDQFDLENDSYGIFSSPPNKADLLGPRLSDGWWYAQPNPGNAAWNVSPFAYQLHKAKYVNPETGEVKRIIMVPSDDVLSYRYGYSNEGIGKIQQFISPFATDPNRPVIVMPSSDGDNAWGGGSSSWFEATPQFFNDAYNAGYVRSAPQDFVNGYGDDATDAHVEDGAWIFPESDYGSPYFLKWIEPPIKTTTATNTYPGTLVDLETPGFALKFFSWAPVIAGANWCETAEQIMTDDGGTVDAWKIQAPYNWNGDYSHNSPNVVERAWHIYLAGLDSGFNYYGGLGNDDEVKQSLATRRAVEMLKSYMDANGGDDATGPTILKPQRFPYNPGAYTFGWFNSIPGGDTRYLKEMPSEFYIWTHAYDYSGIDSITLKLRLDNDGANPLDSNQNEIYHPSPSNEVGGWVSVPMTLRSIPNNEAYLNSAANHGEINYFAEALSTHIPTYSYYFAKITDASLPGFRGKLIDYYIEATDTKDNLRKTDIQHVYVEDDGQGNVPIPAEVSWKPESPTDCEGSTLDVDFVPNDGPLSNSSPITLSYSFDQWTNSVDEAMTESNGVHAASLSITSGVDEVVFAFNDGDEIWDNNDDNDWTVAVRDCPVPSSAAIDPAAPTGCVTVTISYDPGTDLLADNDPVIAHVGVNGWNPVTSLTMTQSNGVWRTPFTVEPGVTEINAAFRDKDSTEWDNNTGADWNWAVSGCVATYDPDICAFWATPVVTADPPASSNQNNVGDNFDFSEIGGGVSNYHHAGFGDFGRLYVNVDSDALFIGGYGVLPDGSNNALVVFVGADTLGLDAMNLWSLDGAPNALDSLHNLEFTQPMDLAILIGDEFGDGTYTNFTVGSGYDHGQGVFYLGPDGFPPVGTAQLSQFDGLTNAPTLSHDDEGGDRQAERWEARIPWSALDATGPDDINGLWLGGLILSDAIASNGVDRYMSGNFLGEWASSVSELDVYNNFGMSFVTLEPLAVCLPHLDGDGDGLLNGYELEYFGHAGSAESDGHGDSDSHTNAEEQFLGTDPTNGDSALLLHDVSHAATQNVITWKSVGGRSYGIDYSDDLTQPDGGFAEFADVTESDVADGVESTESVIDDLTVRPLTGSARLYRVRCVASGL